MSGFDGANGFNGRGSGFGLLLGAGLGGLVVGWLGSWVVLGY